MVEDEVAGGQVVRTWIGPGIESLLGGAVPPGADVSVLCASRVHR